jgi:hypothetical protein
VFETAEERRRDVRREAERTAAQHERLVVRPRSAPTVLPGTIRSTIVSAA